MTDSCDLERLEDFISGDVSPSEAAEVEAHLAACAACRAEVSWLRSERKMFQRRAANTARLSPVLLQRTLETISRPAVRVPPMRQSGAAAVAIGIASAVAIAAGLGWVVARVPTPATTAVATRDRTRLDDAIEALDRAEQSYQTAANLLEAEYASGRPRLDEETAEHYDDQLSSARMRLALARHAAGTDPDARFRVIDGYAEYVRALRNAVYEIPEVNP